MCKVKLKGVLLQGERSCEESGEGLLLCRMGVKEKDEVGVTSSGKI